VKTARFSFILILLCAAAQAQTVFQLDPSKTEIHFTLHDVLHTVHGTFKLKRGAIELDSETGKASGEMVIDVTSGASGNGSRDGRMHKEILESQRYPDAVFTPDRVEGHIAPEGESQIDVHGLFRIHGADRELTLHFEIKAGGGQFTASTHFVIPYVKWGMKNPSNFLLKVDDKVELDVLAVAVPATS
jgi:polyisoprenoid-binding protein YceI